MLFLAVPAVFFVENQREHYIGHKRERQYILLIKELEADTMQLHKVLNDCIGITGLNNLMDLIYRGNGKDIMDIDVREVYYLVFRYARGVTFMDFSSNTLSQLKNTGNMRLIRDRSAVDSFNRMDNLIKLIEHQQDNVVEAIFNANCFLEGGRFKPAEKIREDPVLPVLMTNDPKIHITFANKSYIETGRLLYHGFLKRYDGFATRLISY